MSTHVGAPDRKHHGKLVWPFGEDAVTAALEMVQGAGLSAGDGLAARNLNLPAWWWTATGLVATEDADWSLYAVDGEHGVGVVLTDEETPRVEPTMVRALAAATPLSEDEATALRKALDPTPRDADFPLGAHVIAPRHDAVLLERLAWMNGGPWTVRSWTRIGPGAAPSEFQRLQEAVGAYCVVMVERGQTRTVGVWFGEGEPEVGAEVQPVLRRLFLREGAWRYGVGFAG